MTGLVVIASGARWAGVAGTERRLAEALTRHADVLWLDPPVSVVTRARHRHGAARAWRPRVDVVAPGIRRLVPVAPPGWSRTGVRSLTWRLVRRQLRAALGAVRPHAVIVCSFDDLLIGWEPGTHVVLYGTDDWVAGAELMGQAQDRLLREEKRALARAHVVLAVTPELAERWRALGADPVVMPNGCAAELLAGVAAGKVVPAALPPLPRPVVGVIGQLSARIDIGLLEAVVEAGSGLLLVGPRDPAWEPERSAALLARPEVHHAGPRPPDELPTWLAAIDVGLTPYRDSAFNRAAHPLKTLEYLAAGLPVVSTDLPAARRLRGEGADIELCDDRTKIADAVTRADRGAPGRRAERHAVARGHSWTGRADELAGLIGLRDQVGVRRES